MDDKDPKAKTSKQIVPEKSESVADSRMARAWRSWTEALKIHVFDLKIWKRGFFIVLFFTVFYVCFILLIWWVVLFQFLSQLLTGGINQPLRDLGQKAGSYAQDILYFVTYQTDKLPWPFGPSTTDGKPAQQSSSKKTSA